MIAPAKPKYRTINSKRLQRRIESPWLAADLAGQGHVLAWHCQRQAWPHSEVEQGSCAVLSDRKGPVQSTLAPSNGHDAESGQVARFRPLGCRPADPCRHPQPLRAVGYAHDGGRVHAAIPPGIGVLRTLLIYATKPSTTSCSTKNIRLS